MEDGLVQKKILYLVQIQFMVCLYVKNQQFPCTDEEGEIKGNVQYLYEVNWTRFGNINLEKYDGNKERWISR